MVTEAGIEVHLHISGCCRMGIIWVKQWKRNEVVGKAANFAMVQQARLQSHCSTMGRAPILAWHIGQGLRQVS